MIAFLRAVAYLLCHPGETVSLTVVRRYADARKRFIGELYEGDGPTAKMIGMTCDNLPLKVEPKTACTVRWGRDFLGELEPNTVLVGAAEPQDNVKVHAYISTRRFCSQVVVLNRFVEHILESDYV